MDDHFQFEAAVPEKLGIPPKRIARPLPPIACTECTRLRKFLFPFQAKSGIYRGTLKIDVSFKDDGINLRMQKAAEWFLDEYTGFASGTM